MDKLAEQILLDIIATQMGIDTTRNIWIRSQNRKIPNDEELYIVLGMTDAVPISAQSYMKPDVAEQVEVQETQLKENIQIDLLSRSNAALLRRWEVIAALNSIYSKQKQELHSFKIARLPSSFLNTSAAEGGSELNRFSLSSPCHVWYRKEIDLTEDGKEYFDSFTTRVDDRVTIGEEDGLFEFTIEAEET